MVGGSTHLALAKRHHAHESIGPRNLGEFVKPQGHGPSLELADGQPTIRKGKDAMSDYLNSMKVDLEVRLVELENEAERIRRAIEKVSEKKTESDNTTRRRTISYMSSEGFSAEEISEITQTPMTAVKRIQRYSKKKDV